MKTIFSHRNALASVLLLILASPISADTAEQKRYYPVPPSTPVEVGTEELRDNYLALAGIEGIHVDFSVVLNAGTDKGINVHPDLENMVRNKIHAAGLRMLTEEEMEVTPGQPMLNLWSSYDGVDNNNTEVTFDDHQCRIEPYCRSSLWAGYSESGSIMRRPDMYHRLSTWGSGDDTASCNNRGEWMTQTVLEKVDLLLSDYQKAQEETTTKIVHQEADVPTNCHQPWVMHLDIFATNQTEMNEAVKPIFDKLVDVANNCPSTGYIVETHADARADVKYNKMLTVARAHSIKDYLISKGLAFEKIKTKPMGESQLVSTGTTLADHAINRRVVILPANASTILTTAGLDE